MRTSSGRIRTRHARREIARAIPIPGSHRYEIPGGKMQRTLETSLISSETTLFTLAALSKSGWAGLLAIILAMLLVPAAQAQYRASLRGTVADPSGAVIPGATVTLVDKATNETRTSTSDASGIYTFSALPAGHFRVSVEMQGFKKKEIAEVVLIPDQPNALDLAMEIGDAQQTVTVNGSSVPLLDTDTATVSTTISSDQIQHLPSYNRDVF